MTLNKEDLKNKIIYRASYRGTKEMDILMIAFVKSLINDLDVNYLKTLDSFVNMDDETLISLKKFIRFGYVLWLKTINPISTAIFFL